MRPAAWLAIVLCTVTTTVGCGRRAESGKTLKFGHVLQLDHPYHKMALKFAEEVAQRCPGVKVKVFPAGQLGNERTLVEALQLGTVDVSTITSALTANFVPEFKVFSLPFLFRDPQHLFRVMDSSLGDELAERMEAKGLIRLGYGYGGARDLYGRDPVQSLKDLQGKKVRTMQNPILIATWNQLGAIATPMPWNDLYMSLKQGVVDCAEGTGISYRAMKFYDSSPHFSRIRYVFSWHNVMMSKRTWAKLSEAERGAVLAAAKVAVAFERKEFLAQEQALFDELTKRGVKIHTPPDVAEWAKRAEPVYQKHAQEVGGMELINRIREMK